MNFLYRLKLILFLFLLLILFQKYGFAQNTDKNGTSLSGFVYDLSNGESLVGANIYINELKYGATTNTSGYFIIPDLPTGMYTFIFSYIGFQTEKREIKIEKNKDNHVEVKLKPEAIETDEVIVSDDYERVSEKLFSKPVSKIELNPAQINNIPRFVEADLLRALQTLPGITSLSDFSSALYIRGGTPDQNLYLIDGTDVYNPEHAFGIFSTFNTNAIKKVEVSKGGFGAEYGGRLSSVLDVTNLDGNRNEFEGVANISLLSASTTLQTPIGSIGSLSGSLRRTYIDQTYAKWIDEVPDYYFYDGNLKAYFDIDRNNKLSISFFNGRDDLDFKLDKTADESLEFLYNWGNTTGSINWKHIFSPDLFASFWVTASRFTSNFDFEAISLIEKNKLSDYAFKASLEYYAYQNLTIRFGAEQKLLHELYDQDVTNQRIYIDNNRQLTTGYLTGEWKPNNDWNIQAGLRANYYNADTTYFNIAPRFAIKYRLNDESSLKFATGLYHQYLNRLPRFFISSIWSTANKYNKVSSSKHFILSYQREIGKVWQFETEIYYKDYKNIYQFNDNVGTSIKPSYFDENNRPVYTNTNNVYNRGDGESFGIEFLVKKDIGAINGWISYAWSKTNYKFDKINQQNYFTPRHNRTSIINAVANMDINKFFFDDEYQKSTSKWELGVNFVYASGQPLTVPSSAYYTNTLPDWDDINNGGQDNTDQYNLYPGAINSFNLPDYIRMDLSITYTKDYGSWSLSPYLQIFNIGNRSNVWFIEYKDELKDGKIVQEIEKVNMLPLIPSLGVNIKF